MSHELFSLHAANQMLKRFSGVPLEAMEAVKIMTPLLTEKPLRFTYKKVTVVARMIAGSPTIITAWQQA